MDTTNIYQRKGLQRIINASGRMTKLGVSAIHDEVGKVVVEAAQNYVVIDDLMVWAGKEIGRLIGCADACVTSSASAGITLSVSSLITKDNETKAEYFFNTLKQADKREVIVLKGHNVNFGARIDTIVALGGGDVVEVGSANRSTIADIKEAVGDKTLAILFVKSHHCVQKKMVEVEEVISLANSLNVPCIVDAAAEEDLKKYIKLGADLVCYSGAKAICGPTSGFVACKTVKLADNMRLQYKGIGRSMKVGKENIMGLVKAIDMYQGELTFAVSRSDLEAGIKEINGIDGLSAIMVQDEAGREIYRARIKFDKTKYGLSAKEVNQRLHNNDPGVYLRDHEANMGYLAIDPRPLTSVKELQEIISILRNWKMSKA